MSAATVTIIIGVATLAIGAFGAVSPPHWAPRPWHRFYARTHGYFWLPCPLCGNNTGGHEWHDHNGLSSSIPDPKYPPNSGRSIGICQDCTRAGLGQRGELLIGEAEEAPDA